MCRFRSFLFASLFLVSAGCGDGMKNPDASVSGAVTFNGQSCSEDVNRIKNSEDVRPWNVSSYAIDLFGGDFKKAKLNFKVD